MTYPSKRQATSDSSGTSENGGVTRGVTARGQKYSGFAATGDSSDSILQAILSWKKKRGKQAEDYIDFIRNPYSLHTLQNGVTTVTTCHGPGIFRRHEVTPSVTVILKSCHHCHLNPNV